MLIVDLGALDHVSGPQAGALARLLSEAQTAGVRTAVCSPTAAITHTLQQLAEASATVFAKSEVEACRSL